MNEREKLRHLAKFLILTENYEVQLALKEEEHKKKMSELASSHAAEMKRSKRIWEDVVNKFYIKNKYLETHVQPVIVNTTTRRNNLSLIFYYFDNAQLRDLAEGPDDDICILARKVLRSRELRDEPAGVRVISPHILLINKIFLARVLNKYITPAGIVYDVNINLKEWLLPFELRILISESPEIKCCEVWVRGIEYKLDGILQCKKYEGAIDTLS